MSPDRDFYRVKMIVGKLRNSLETHVRYLLVFRVFHDLYRISRMLSIKSLRGTTMLFKSYCE